MTVDDSSSDGSSAPLHRVSGEVAVLPVKWSAIGKVNTNEVRTYGTGFGEEYVYCYSFPIFLEVASLKQEPSYRVKVGKATGNPINRIHQQISASKTAISESPIVLVIFQAISAHQLEKWLHKRLERAVDAVGAEWFYTNPDELLELFREYERCPTGWLDEPSVAQVSKAAPRRLPTIASKCVDGFVVYHEDGRPLSFQLQLVHLMWANMARPISVGELREVVAAKLGVRPEDVPAKFDQQIDIELGKTDRAPRFQLDAENRLTLVPGKKMPRARTANPDGSQR